MSPVWHVNCYKFQAMQMMNRILTHLCLVQVVVILPSGMLHGAVLLDTNLIVNGDGEAAVGAGNFAEGVAIPGWTTTGSFTTVQYAIGGANDLNADVSTSISGGANYFAGGPGGVNSSASQLISLTEFASLIDAGALTARLSGFLGGFGFQNDQMLVVGRFFDESDALLDSFSIGPVTSEDRLNDSQLLFRTADALVPIGTRSVEIVMLASISAGFYNDGYADNLDFRLIPEPSVPLLGVFGMCIACFRRRRDRFF